MNRNAIYRLSTVISLSAMAFAAACKNDAPQSADKETAPTTNAAPAVTPTGRIVTIEAYSDGAGNYFKPKEVEVKRGDVVRFVLKAGVHNINFLPDSNPGAKYLPPASEMLQLPEQTHDITIAMEPGSYFFQCDPHAMLGMTGRIKVSN